MVITNLKLTNLFCAYVGTRPSQTSAQTSSPSHHRRRRDSFMDNFNEYYPWGSRTFTLKSHLINVHGGTYVGTYEGFLQAIGTAEERPQDGKVGSFSCPEFTYEGQWERGLPHGWGEFTVRLSKFRFTYRGNFEYGARNGYGTQTLHDGTTYNGEWSDNKRHGQGEFIKANGITYNGTWNYDSMHGQGILTMPDGSEYNGEMKVGKMHGQGEFTFPDGAKYKGTFEDDKRHGHGQMIYSSGICYNGGWRYGKRHGQGELRLLNGAKYIGTWNDDEAHGQGQFVYPKTGVKQRAETRGDELHVHKGKGKVQRLPIKTTGPSHELERHMAEKPNGWRVYFVIGLFVVISIAAFVALALYRGRRTRPPGPVPRRKEKRKRAQKNPKVVQTRRQN
eukprot:jgi/Botrbrau1/6281/Bobra.0129s0026.1